MKAYNYCLVFQNLNDGSIVIESAIAISHNSEYLKSHILRNSVYTNDSSYELRHLQIIEIDQTIINAIKEL